MKLIDKIKNYFYDEEEDSAGKANSPKKEQPSIKTMTNDNKEEKQAAKEENLDAIGDRELFKTDSTFNFPVIFDDDDFKEEEQFKNPGITVAKKEQTKIEEKIETKVFKPSLNISPIYGVIDDNVQSSNANATADNNLLNLYEENKKIDIDDILGKVYEQSRVEVKRENYKSIAEEIKPSKDDLSLDFFDNLGTTTTREEVKQEIDITKESVKNIDEKLKTIDELLENTDDDDFYSLVDSMYKETNEEEDN